MKSLRLPAYFKLQQRFVGPFGVLSWVYNVAHKIQPTGKVIIVHNIFNLSLFHPYLPGGTQQRPLDPVIAGDNQEYEIKRIVFQKKIRCKLVYQVRWRSYAATEDSWLREEDLANASDLLQTYQFRHGISLFYPALDFWYQWASRGMPYTLIAPLPKRVCSFWELFLASQAGPPVVRDFFSCLILGLFPSTLG